MSLLVWVLCGCIPARDVPPQLSATAAPAYRLTNDSLITEKYTLTPPHGWRVIAGAAEDPYTFQFVSPDNTALMVVSDRALSVEALPAPAGLGVALADSARSVSPPAETDRGITVYSGYISPPDQAVMIEQELRQMLDSLR